MLNLAFSAIVVTLLLGTAAGLSASPSNCSSTPTTRRFVDKVQCLLTQHPGSVTSWIRSVKRNRAVGGSPNSKHLVGMAVDVVLDDPSEDIAQTCNRLHLRCLDEGDHVHVEKGD